MRVKKKDKLLLHDEFGNLLAAAESVNEYEKLPSDSYIYLFDGDGLDLIKQTKSVATLKVFFALAFMLRGGDSCVYLSPVERDAMLKEYGLSNVSFCAAINELEERRILIRGTLVDKYTGEISKKLRRGQYMINPSAAWKGTRESRRMSVDEYDNLIVFTKSESHE